MIKRMNGIKKEFGYPVLTENNAMAVTDEKTDVGKRFCGST